MMDTQNYETPNNRTLGECLQAEADSIRLIDGKFTTTLSIKHKPKRLSREMALIYYTGKLRKIWAGL